jgi:putative membrane protein
MPIFYLLIITKNAFHFYKLILQVFFFSSFILNLPQMKNSSSTTSFLSKVLVGGISVFLADFLLSGVQITSLLSGIILVVVIILINFTIKPLIVLLTLPLSLITFGLFLLVINAVLVLLAAELTPGFSVDGFWWAMAFALILSLINSILGVSLDSGN